MGILTHKAIADALRTDGDPLRREAEALLGPALVVGHFGRDEKGSNDFQSCRALVILGAPRPDLRSVEDDAAFLAMPKEALYRARVETAVVQAVGRARHVRRAECPPLIAYIADDFPPAIPGGAWTSIATPQGAPEDAEAREAAARIADRDGRISAARLRQETTIPARTAARVAEEIAAGRGWSAFSVPNGRGRPITVYAPDEAAISAVQATNTASSVAVVLTPPPPAPAPSLTPPRVGEGGAYGPKPAHVAARTSGGASAHLSSPRGLGFYSAPYRAAHRRPPPSPWPRR